MSITDVILKLRGQKYPDTKKSKNSTIFNPIFLNHHTILVYKNKLGDSRY
jgi:hypothetical protein